MDFLDILLDAFLDALKTLPFLLAVYLLIEFIEHRSPKKLSNCLARLGTFGAVGGAVLGCVPQCGFSVAASNLYSGKLITMGTLIAVFLSTSDEALPIMLSHPEQLSVLWKLIVIKVIIAIIAGILVDVVIKFVLKQKIEQPAPEELCSHSHCDCEHNGIFVSALRHTVGIFIFIFVVNLILSLAIGFIGEDNLGKILMTDSVFQPFLAALIGFIPNCAASVVLTELFISGGISFGSLAAGLCTGAGVGLVVLFRTNRHLKQNLTIIGIMYVVGVASGVLINLFA